MLAKDAFLALPLISYSVYTSPDHAQNEAFRPPSPPILGGTGVFQSPPELGDLGGLSTSNVSRKNLCVHRSLSKRGHV